MGLRGWARPYPFPRGTLRTQKYQHHQFTRDWIKMLWGPSEQGCTEEWRPLGCSEGHWRGIKDLCCSSALIPTSDLSPWLRAERHLHHLPACKGSEWPAQVETPTNGDVTAESHSWCCKGFPRKAAHQFWAAGAVRHQFLELSQPLVL